MRSSRLIGGAFRTPAEAVGWHLAMQAQDYGPAKWSIGQRSRDLLDRDVDGALAEGSIVRTHVLRPTWHVVAREDLRWLLALSGPRVQRANAGRYAQLELEARARARGQKLIASALAGGNRLTRDELAQVLDAARFDRDGQRMSHLLMHCELEAVICSGGLAGNRQTYALLDDRVPVTRALDRDEALVELVRRYLRSHGPATVKDASWWSGLTMADIRSALDLLGSEVRSDILDGLTLWSIAPGPVRAATTRGAHLLQTYDELVVGYSESRFRGDPGAERARAAWADRSLPGGVVILDGRIAGHWRRTTAPRRVAVEVRVHDTPGAAALRSIEKAAASLGRFVERAVTLDVKRV